MASPLHSIASISVEIFREVDQYDLLADISETSGEHHEAHMLNSPEVLGDEGPTRNQLAYYQGEEDTAESRDSPWFEVYPSWLDASNEANIRALSHAPEDYEFCSLVLRTELTNPLLTTKPFT